MKKHTSGSLGFVLMLFSICLIDEEELTVVSWGGSYANACIDGYFKPFEEETGIKVNVEDYNGGLAQIRAQVESGKIQWDVIDVESHDDLIDCEEGLLEYLGDLELPDAPDGTPTAEDFFKNANSDKGIGTIVWLQAQFTTRQLLTPIHLQQLVIISSLNSIRVNVECVSHRKSTLSLRLWPMEYHQRMSIAYGRLTKGSGERLRN